MNLTSEPRRRYSGAPFFSFGFRPFFLGGAIVAATVPMLTALSFGGVLSSGSAYGAVGYHGHEMVFGYLGAVVSGFILTAVPNWTGRLPVVGCPLMALFGLWAAGRLAILASGMIGPEAAAAIDGPYLFILSAVLWREIVSGKNWRNIPICVLITFFATGNLIWHFDLLAGGTGGFGMRLGIAVIALLLALIGGRITPGFTRSWFVKTGRRAAGIAFRMLDKSALAVTAVAVAAWACAPLTAISGVLLPAAAGLLFFRLLRWQGWRTAAEPLVTILHLGYLWLAASLALLGVSALFPAMLMPSAAVHALMAGAAGVMTLAVMTRATLGHTGRELRADLVTVVIYGLVNVGALLRLLAGLVPQHYDVALTVAALFWSGAFVLFTARYGRYLTEPRVEARAEAA